MKAAVFGEADMKVIEWAAWECTRQRSGEVSVWWMLSGWQHAMLGFTFGLPLTEEFIKLLGWLVEPRANKSGAGYRRAQVWVGNSKKPPPERVPELMKALVDAQGVLHPDEWFYEYEEIHPFGDGNGRTGSILWNYLGGTLDEPVNAPDFWNMPEREDLW